MWNQPYLETCCRAALHRLFLCGDAGRPPTPADAACLRRLTAMGLSSISADGTWRITAQGLNRHASEILRTRTIQP